MQAHTSPPKVAAVGSAHSGIHLHGIPGRRGRVSHWSTRVIREMGGPSELPHVTPSQPGLRC